MLKSIANCMNILYEQKGHPIDIRNALSNTALSEVFRIFSYYSPKQFAKARQSQTMLASYTLYNIVRSDSSQKLALLGRISRAAVAIGCVSKIGSFATAWWLSKQSATAPTHTHMRLSPASNPSYLLAMKFKKLCDMAINVCDMAAAISNCLDYAEIRNIMTTYRSSASAPVDNPSYKQISSAIAIAKIVHLIADKIFSISSLFHLKTDLIEVYHARDWRSPLASTSKTLTKSDIVRFASKFICDSKHVKLR